MSKIKKVVEPEIDFGRNNTRCSPVSDKHSDYQKLCEEVGRCNRCPLYRNRINPVIYKGSIESRIAFIGDGPGQEEDRVGQPFVGPSGKYIDRLLKVVGIPLDKIVWLNLLCCRPKNNVFPSSETASICVETFLWRQLDIIKPKAICLLGRKPAEAILGFTGKSKVSVMMGKAFVPPPRIKSYCEEIFVTYHPSYVLRKSSLAPEVAEHLECFKTDLKLMNLIPRN